MIGIVDYGMGNLHSVKNACDHLGLQVRICTSAKELAGCSKLILPGVGAFQDMAAALEKTGMGNEIRRLCKKGKTPLLGICLGMQALYELSHEFGTWKGLGFLKGEVNAMEPFGVRIPEIGWNELIISEAHPLFSLLPKRPFVYFDHSYLAQNWNPSELIAYTQYGPYCVPAIVGRDNILGTQFHPEKSGRVGLAILEWFGKEFCV